MTSSTNFNRCCDRQSNLPSSKWGGASLRHGGNLTCAVSRKIVAKMLLALSRFSEGVELKPRCA